MEHIEYLKEKIKEKAILIMIIIITAILVIAIIIIITTEIKFFVTINPLPLKITMAML